MGAPRILAVLAVCAVFVACTSTSSRPAPPGAPPAGRPGAAPAGHLLIVGGGPLPPAVLARFVELAGGPGAARIVLFPMASSDPEAGVELAGDFRKMGAHAERIVLNHAAADTAEAAA